MREEKKLLEQQIDNICSLIEQVMEDKGKIQDVQELKNSNIVEQIKNINSEGQKAYEILKDFDYNQLENVTKLKLIKAN